MWANSILYVFMSSSLQKCFFCCKTSRSSRDGSLTSNNHSSYESFSTVTVVKNIENDWF